MEWKIRYVKAFARADPKAFNLLSRSGRLEQHLKEKGLEVQELLRELLAREPRNSRGQVANPNAVRCAEEVVMSQLLDFPVPERGVAPENE